MRKAFLAWSKDDMLGSANYPQKLPILVLKLDVLRSAGVQGGFYCDCCLLYCMHRPRLPVGKRRTESPARSACPGYPGLRVSQVPKTRSNDYSADETGKRCAGGVLYALCGFDGRPCATKPKIVAHLRLRRTSANTTESE
jgi:hypothetical protein